MLRNLVLMSCALVFVSACERDIDMLFEDGDSATAREIPPLKLPAARIARDRERLLLEALDEFRGVETDYLGRVKAEEGLKRRLSEGETDIIPYIVQLLDDPQWDVRAAALRLIMQYGGTTRSAVAALVQVLGDVSMNAAVRDDAAKTLRDWSGQHFGYQAYDTPERVRERAAQWQEWFDQNGQR